MRKTLLLLCLLTICMSLISCSAKKVVDNEEKVVSTREDINDAGEPENKENLENVASKTNKPSKVENELEKITKELWKVQNEKYERIISQLDMKNSDLSKDEIFEVMDLIQGTWLVYALNTEAIELIEKGKYLTLTFEEGNIYLEDVFDDIPIFLVEAYGAINEDNVVLIFTPEDKPNIEIAVMPIISREKLIEEGTWNRDIQVTVTENSSEYATTKYSVFEGAREEHIGQYDDIVDIINSSRQEVILENEKTALTNNAREFKSIASNNPIDAIVVENTMRSRKFGEIASICGEIIDINRTGDLTHGIIQSGSILDKAIVQFYCYEDIPAIIGDNIALYGYIDDLGEYSMQNTNGGISTLQTIRLEVKYHSLESDIVTNDDLINYCYGTFINVFEEEPSNDWVQQEFPSIDEVIVTEDTIMDMPYTLLSIQRRIFLSKEYIQVTFRFDDYYDYYGTRRNREYIDKWNPDCHILNFYMDGSMEVSFTWIETENNTTYFPELKVKLLSKWAIKG